MKSYVEFEKGFSESEFPVPPYFNTESEKLVKIVFKNHAVILDNPSSFTIQKESPSPETVINYLLNIRKVTEIIPNKPKKWQKTWRKFTRGIPIPGYFWVNIKTGLCKSGLELSYSSRIDFFND